MKTPLPCLLAAVAVLLAFAAGARAEESKVIWKKVRENGLVATYLRPKGDQPLAAVIVLGGSEGGIKSAEMLAYRFAANGWAALAVAYFGMEPLPKSLAAVPLETIDGAVSWLQYQPLLKPNEISLVGVSRGAELALLVAAHNPAITRVVAIVPSHVAWGRVGHVPGNSISAWTVGGEEVPCVTPLRQHDYWAKPYHGTPDFLSDLQQKEKVAAAEIAVENIHGPVLLLSGDDDQIWPSSLMSRLIMKRLKLAHHPYRDQHLSFPGAGHVIVPGFDPGMTEAKHPTGMLLAFGGSKKANRAAQEQGWENIKAFLRSDAAPAREGIGGSTSNITSSVSK